MDSYGRLTGQCNLGCLRSSKGRVLYTNVGGKIFVSLDFVFSLHFIKRMVPESTGGLKLPVTLGASITLKILGLNPDKFPWHRHSSPDEKLSSFMPRDR